MSIPDYIAFRGRDWNFTLPAFFVAEPRAEPAQGGGRAPADPAAGAGGHARGRAEHPGRENQEDEYDDQH